MAITEDMDFPRLTPPDDKMPSGRRLYRRPEELTDDQFDMLAAAWAEGALTGEALAELESVMTASPGRRDRAGSFRNIRLVPDNESWPGMRSAFRLSPALTAFRRSAIPALLAVAAMVVIIIYGPAGAKLKTINAGRTVTGNAMTVAEIPASAPIIAVKRITVTPVQPVPVEQTPVAEAREEAAEASEVIRVKPLALTYSHVSASSVAPAVNPVMTPISIRDIQPARTLQEEKNWMFRSMSFLAGAVTGKEKEVNGYMIANGCITGINNILGWNMELEQVSNKSGEPVAVTFSSSLLSFTKPLNKNTP
jgi:hypothetical protein